MRHERWCGRHLYKVGPTIRRPFHSKDETVAVVEPTAGGGVDGRGVAAAAVPSPPSLARQTGDADARQRQNGDADTRLLQDGDASGCPLQGGDAVETGVGADHLDDRLRPVRQRHHVLPQERQELLDRRAHPVGPRRRHGYGPVTQSVRRLPVRVQNPTHPYEFRDSAVVRFGT